MASYRILLTEGEFVQLRLPLPSGLVSFLHVFQYIGTLKGLLSNPEVASLSLSLVSLQTIDSVEANSAPMSD